MRIVSHVTTQKYRDGWEQVFGTVPAKKKPDNTLLHVAACYFNPNNSKTVEKLKNNFVAHMRATRNVALYMVELIYVPKGSEEQWNVPEQYTIDNVLTRQVYGS